MIVSVIGVCLIYSIISTLTLARVVKRCPLCVIDATPPNLETIAGFGFIACIAFFVAGLLWVLIVRGQRRSSD